MRKFLLIRSSKKIVKSIHVYIEHTVPHGKTKMKANMVFKYCDVTSVN